MKKITKKLAKKILNKYQIKTLPIPKKEYKDDIFMLGLEEGGEFLDAKPINFTGRSITGDVGKGGYPIVFYVKVVGFEDDGAIIRNWGMNLKKFQEHYSSRR